MFNITPYIRYVYAALFLVAVVLFIRGKIIDARYKREEEREKAEKEKAQQAEQLQEAIEENKED